MKIYIGIDDTDNLESRGTGRLARSIAEALSADFRIQGVTRHQLLVDPRVPYTSHNSSACLHVDSDQAVDLAELAEYVKAIMLADFQPGSDPGLCVTVSVPEAVQDFGRRAKTDLVNQAMARHLAEQHQILLVGLGGTQDGVIGSLAAVGLGAWGEDGRYLLLGATRELSGLQPVAAVLAAGIHQVCTAEGVEVSEGQILSDKLRPARRAGLPVQYVEWQGEHWLPLKYN